MKEEGFSPEASGAFAGAGLGLLGAIWRVETFVPVEPVYGCGMDKGFALIGLAVVGVIGGALFGCVLGAILGAMLKTE